MNTVEEPQTPAALTDDDRTVDLSDDEFVVLPEQPVGEGQLVGWADGFSSNDERLFAERPPHWD